MVLSVFHKIWWIHTNVDHAFAKGCKRQGLSYVAFPVHAGRCGGSRITTLKPQSIIGHQDPQQGEQWPSGELENTHFMEEQLVVLWTIWELNWENFPFSRIPEGGILKGKRKLILGVAFLRQGHQFLDIPPIEKWGLCPLPMNLSGLVLLWPMEYGGRDVTWLPRLGHAMSWDSALLAGLLLESWALQRGKPCISALDDSPSWAHPSSHPSPGTSRLHEISRWFLSPAVLINLRWGPRYYRADTSHAPLSPIQIPAPQNLSVS